MTSMLPTWLTQFWTLIVIAFLVLIGSYLRLTDLGTQPYWMDEGYTINAVLTISETGTNILDSGLPYSCPIYCRPTALIADTFGHEAVSYRVLAAVFGILLIPLFFIIGRHFFSLPVGLLTAFFITFEYFQLAWSRQARWYTLFAFLFWLALYAFYRAYYEPSVRWRYGALALAATTLTILTHGLGYLLPFIMLGWVLIDKVILERQYSWRFFGLSTLACVAIALVLELVFGTTRITRLFTDFTLYNVAPYYLAYYLSTYWPLVPLIVAGLWRLPRPYHRPVGLLLLSVVLYAIPLFFLTNLVHYRYAWHLTPVLFLLASLGLYRLALLPSPITRYSLLTIGSGLVLLFGTLTFTPQPFYWLEHDDPATERRFPGTAGYYAYTPQPDWNSAYAFIAAERRAEDTIISSHPHFNKIFLREPGYWLGYNYLGLSDLPNSIRDGREYYVGALVLGSLPELRTHTATHTGYLIFDHMAADNRIPAETIQYIRTNYELIYHDQSNPYSQIWIYRF